MAKEKDPTKRQTSFWNSDTPLMSERVRRLISNPENGDRLVDAIIAMQRGDTENASFVAVEDEQRPARQRPLSE